MGQILNPSLCLASAGVRPGVSGGNRRESPHPPKGLSLCQGYPPLAQPKLSSAISSMERSSLRMDCAAASTSGRTCRMKYFAAAIFPW